MDFFNPRGKLNPADVEYVDNLINDYLLFRGFLNTREAFQLENKADKNKGYQASKIVQHIFGYIQSFDFPGFLNLWSHLTETFFVRLEEDLSWTVAKLELSLKRFYVINAIQSGRRDKCLEFFQEFGPTLCQNKSWKGWFVLPYSKSPQTDTSFKVYFTKSWLDTLQISLHNFLSSIFKSMDPPKILQFTTEREIRASMQRELDRLKSDSEKLRQSNDQLKKQCDVLQKKFVPATKSTPILPIISPSMHRSEMVATVNDKRPLDHYNNNFVSPTGDTELQRSSTPERKKRTEVGLDRDIEDTNDNDDSDVYDNINEEGYELKKFSASTPSRRAHSTDVPTQYDSPTKSKPSAQNIVPFTVKKRNLFSANYPINCLQFSPDGYSIACGSSGGVARVWSVYNPNRSGPAVFGSSPITAIEWERNSKLLLCGSTDGKVKLWNVTADQIVGEINMPSTYKRVTHIQCSPQAEMFAVSSGQENIKRGGTLTLWDFNRLQTINKLRFDPPMRINSFVFDSRGQNVVAAGQDGTIRVFDINNCKLVARWKAHEPGVAGVCLGQDDSTMFSVGHDSQIKMWNLSNPANAVKTYNFPGLHESVSTADIALDPSKNFFVIGSQGNNAIIYHVENESPVQGVGSHGKPVVAVDWHPTDYTCATGSLDNTVSLTQFDSLL